MTLPKGPNDRRVGAVLLAIANGETAVSNYVGGARAYAIVDAAMHDPPLVETEGANLVLTAAGHAFVDLHAPPYYAKWGHVWKRSVGDAEALLVCQPALSLDPGKAAEALASLLNRCAEYFGDPDVNAAFAALQPRPD